MNKRLAKKLFNFDILVENVTGVSSMGDPKKVIKYYKGYIKEEIKLVTDSLGKEATSSLQVYFKGEDIIEIMSTSKISVGNLNVAENIPPGVDLTQMDTAGAVAAGYLVFAPLYVNKQILKREVFYIPGKSADLGVLYLP